jgi:hypothetical protein
MFVGAVVVGDQMDLEPGRDVAVEVIKERQEFLMAMARLALRDDRTTETFNENWFHLSTF